MLNFKTQRTVGIMFNSANPGPGSGSTNAYTGIGVQGFLTLTKIWKYETWNIERKSLFFMLPLPSLSETN